MSRRLAVIASLAFLALAPGTVVVLVPWWLTRWRMGPPLLILFTISGVVYAVRVAPLQTRLRALARASEGGAPFDWDRYRA